MKKETAAKDTKSSLLDAAEALFMENGYEVVSIRQITDAADANVAAINYHFSGKVNLYREVLRRRFAEVARSKVEVIDRSIETCTENKLHDIVEAYVRSHFDDILSNPEGERLLQVVYREMSPEAVASDLVTSELITPVHKALHSAIKKTRPDLSDSFISRCISSISGQVLHFIRFRDVIKGYANIQSDQQYIDEMTQHITGFSLQGIGSETNAPQ